MKRMLWLTSLLAVVIGAPELSAWGDHAHEIVARLAARKLTPNTQRKLVAILRNARDD